MTSYKVSIDQDDCTGCGKCADDSYELFFMWDEDGLAYTKAVTDRDGRGEDGTPRLKGIDGLAHIPDRLLDDVIDIASDCPGECIYITETERC